MVAGRVDVKMCEIAVIHFLFERTRGAQRHLRASARKLEFSQAYTRALTVIKHIKEPDGAHSLPREAILKS